jgi:hypothetical protein
MTDEAPMRDDGSLDRARSELAGADGYPLYQRTGADEGARPQEYDALGFPIPQRGPTFLERVARLLNPL